jgi:hypothetical protein
VIVNEQCRGSRSLELTESRTLVHDVRRALLVCMDTSVDWVILASSMLVWDFEKLLCKVTAYVNMILAPDAIRRLPSRCMDAVTYLRAYFDLYLRNS